jgi:hypothetical protein
MRTRLGAGVGTAVEDVLRRAFREIRAIAAASQPVQPAALLNLQLVTWND